MIFKAMWMFIMLMMAAISAAVGAVSGSVSGMAASMMPKMMKKRMKCKIGERPKRQSTTEATFFRATAATSVRSPPFFLHLLPDARDQLPPDRWVGHAVAYDAPVLTACSRADVLSQHIDDAAFHRIAVLRGDRDPFGPENVAQPLLAWVHHEQDVLAPDR